MTKAALKRKNARLIEKRDRMNVLIEGNEQEIKELDSIESRQLLEKFNIESEELAKLIYLRDRANSTANEKEEEETPVKRRGRKTKAEAESPDEAIARPWDEAEDDVAGTDGTGEEADTSDETDDAWGAKEDPRSSEETGADAEPEDTAEEQESYDPLHIARARKEA